MATRILIGDVREKLKELADESVHTVVTSPPYWGLRCYGVDGQLGQEATYQEHIETMVDVFREVKRVLRKDGTLWLNYGDSYASSVNGRPAAEIVNDDRTFRDKPFSTIQGVLKPKDLCGIPWRVAFALQADGWYLRQDIIWAKPNPMPESVKDRCTKAHEYIFLLTKSPRYYFDAEAIREPNDAVHMRWLNVEYKTTRGTDESGVYQGKLNQHRAGAKLEAIGRNKRSVWEIPTSPFPEAHFATFPPELPEICIRAGTSEKGCCGKCWKPWIRNTEVSRTYESGSAKSGNPIRGKQGAVQGGGVTKDLRLGPVVRTETLGWSPSCQCNVYEPLRPAVESVGLQVCQQPFTPVPCTVLDPFGGAGTTGLVADRLQRNAILIELNPTYAELARKRISGDAPMFAEVTA